MKPRVLHRAALYKVTFAPPDLEARRPPTARDPVANDQTKPIRPLAAARTTPAQTAAKPPSGSRTRVLAAVVVGVTLGSLGFSALFLSGHRARPLASAAAPRPAAPDTLALSAVSPPATEAAAPALQIAEAAPAQPLDRGDDAVATSRTRASVAHHHSTRTPPHHDLSGSPQHQPRGYPFVDADGASGHFPDT
jgi:hypothetical protein